MQKKMTQKLELIFYDHKYKYGVMKSDVEDTCQVVKILTYIKSYIYIFIIFITKLFNFRCVSLTVNKQFCPIL